MDTKGKGIQKIETFEGWPGLTEFTQLCSKYEPFIARFVHGLPDQRHQILAYLNSSSTLTDISCAEGDGAFSGNPSTREKVDMKVSDFANAWSCEKDGKHHWALTTGLNLYLSQLCLSQGCDTDGSDMELLHCGIPGVLLQSGSSLDRTNLWMNIFPAVSSLHYDANHNLLVVLEGSKHVTLFSPACTKYLQPEAAHGDCPNHSGLGPLEADSAARTISEQGGDGCATCTVTIHAGDALFIPEGWWHQVRSEKCTMALNYWFCSSAGLLLSGTGATDMSSYLLRAAMHRVVNAQRSADARHAACEESVSKAGSHVYHTAVTVRSFEESTMRLLSHGARGREGEAGVDKCKLSRTSPRLGREEAEEEVEEEEDPWLAFVSCDVAAMRALWVPFGRKVCRCVVAAAAATSLADCGSTSSQRFIAFSRAVCTCVMSSTHGSGRRCCCR